MSDPMRDALTAAMNSLTAIRFNLQQPTDDKQRAAVNELDRVRALCLAALSAPPDSPKVAALAPPQPSTCRSCDEPATVPLCETCYHDLCRAFVSTSRRSRHATDVVRAHD